MKKITLLLLFLMATFTAQAQFPEGFETAVPPTGWATFIGTNGEGTGQDWQATTAAGTFASGAQAAYVRYENVANSAEDWLVTPQFTPTAAANILSFQQRQAFGSDYGTTYTIRVSTASQTTHADFTIVDTQSETDFGTVYSTHYVDLSAYDGMAIYVAFVMEQDDGDNWYVDDVDLIPNASAPNCATNPTPADGATGVVLTGTNVTISWDAPATGDAATGYEIFWGTTSGSLTSLGKLSATTVDITNIDLSTTYYWMIVPENVGGSATGCTEWSFTTEDPPPPPPNDTLAGAIPITPSPEGTGCATAGFTLNFSSDGTTDSGLDGTCNTTDTGLDQFFTWTATTEGLLWNDQAPGNPGIVIRDPAGNEIACGGTFAGDDTILDGWSIGDDLIIQIYDYAGSVSDVAFCLELYTPPAPIVPNYTNDFTVFPGDQWTEASGAFMTPTGTTGGFTSDDFGNDTGHANGQSARINIFGTLTDEYLITPAFNLSGSTYYLNFDIAYTEFSGTAAANFGADDYVALLVTEDDGASWTELTRWDSGSTVSNTGESAAEIVLSGYGADVKFAFYAFSDTSNEDNNFYIDNFRITTTTLGVEDNKIEGFSLFPTIVKQDLNYRAQSNVEEITVFNLLGQKVFFSKPNVTDSHVDLSSLKGGLYIVKVKVGGQVGTYKIIKE
ncbi:MAG: choice-of-anchor J domain-containing protein [Flavobacteriaceae bacterium]